MKLSAVAVTLSLAAAAGSANAAITPFDLLGKAGAGLLPGNENATINGIPGTGGEVGAGISYNDVTNVLTVNVGWGSGNGFANLSKDANVGHIHGPTLTASFLENAGIRYGLDNLPGWNPSGSNGSFIGTVNILEEDEAALFAGRFYINIHTGPSGGIAGVNPGGEIRGNLVPVPEPGTVALLLAGLGVLGIAARRRLNG